LISFVHLMSSATSVTQLQVSVEVRSLVPLLIAHTFLACILSCSVFCALRQCVSAANFALRLACGAQTHASLEMLLNRMLQVLVGNRRVHRSSTYNTIQ
jgi:hypothetical protein